MNMKNNIIDTEPFKNVTNKYKEYINDKSIGYVG